MQFGDLNGPLSGLLEVLTNSFEDVLEKRTEKITEDFEEHKQNLNDEIDSLKAEIGCADEPPVCARCGGEFKRE